MTASGIDRALLLARTVRHLDPAQVVHRIRLRSQKAVLGAVPGLIAPRLRRPVPARPAWPEGYLPLDGQLAQGYPSAEANAEGRFCFLDEQRVVERSSAGWEQADADQLWRYHLHYFEWAWAFVSHPDRDWARARFARLWSSWDRHTTFGRWDAWSPYVVSLRSWALCGAYRPLVEGSDNEARYASELALHAGFTKANLELDVGGNHLIKNLKALMGLGVLLDDARLVSLARRHLEREIAIQVLSDGGHFELSPSYHCQVLGDLIDIAELLKASDRPPVEGLGDAIQAMRRWLGVILMPDGEVPMFNDCTFVGAHRLKLLEPEPAARRRLVVLQPSGYVVMRPDDRLHLVADVGPPCPPQLPAHAHADCLSFELAVDGERVIVNSGTSTYTPGERRTYERSTRAHNTVEIDGHDQTEVWGTFRAARRARCTLKRASDDGHNIEVTASHDGYQRLPGSPVHRRTWRTVEDAIEVTDEVTGGSHKMVNTLHVAPDVVVDEAPAGYAIGPLALSTATVNFERFRRKDGRTSVATDFGQGRPATELTLTASGTAPLHQRIRLKLRQEGAGAGTNDEGRRDE